MSLLLLLNQGTPPEATVVSDSFTLTDGVFRAVVVVSDSATLTDTTFRTQIVVSDSATLTDSYLVVRTISDSMTLTDTYARVSYGRVVFPWLEPVDGSGSPKARY